MDTNKFIQTSKKLFLMLFTVVSMVVLFSSNSFASKKTPIIIAHVSPTTGRFAVHSEADYRGVKMAIDEYNSKGGALGRDLLLVQQNPTSDTKKAAVVAKELIEKNKIGFMVGAVNSGVAASMSAVCQKYGVIFINTNSSSPSEAVEDAHRTKFVFDANGANYNKTLMKYALNKSKTKKVLLLTEDNEWGISNASATKQYLQSYNGKIVKEILVSQTLLDPTTLIREIKSVDADVVAVNISGNNQVKLFAAIDPKTFDTQSWVIGEADWEDLYLAPGNIRPLFGVNWSWNLDTKGTKEFVAKYRKIYKNTKLAYPGHVTYSAYQATKALIDAIIKTKTTHNHTIIKELEQYKSSAINRMQDSAAYMDPKSHHLQQSTYVATWRQNIKEPHKSIKILGHIAPQDSRYDKEDTTQLESFEETPHYTP
ncbi:MAG: ABC transporter substrate-binding protein [Arcobacteraceae bacterium]|nr:ABC transporter substrate-binding protein [Arcobacteraceae bacterium]